LNTNTNHWTSFSPMNNTKTSMDINKNQWTSTQLNAHHRNKWTSINIDEHQ
jgi:hypothetical protein